MKTDRIKLYIGSALATAVPFLALFVNTGMSRLLSAMVTAALLVLVLVLTRRRTTRRLHGREMLLISGACGVLFVLLTQLSGLFFEFYKNPYFVNTKILLETILPLAFVIVGSEVIRAVLLAQKNKVASVAAFAAPLLLELVATASLLSLTNSNRVMDFVGMTLVPAVTAGVWFHYVARRYAAAPNIAYRLIVTLLPYFLPMTTGISEALLSISYILYPLVLLALTTALFGEKKRKRKRVWDTVGKISTVLSLLVAVGVAMLVSCQFRFGALVVATDSMEGEINVGDMIVYERYEGEKLEVGEVIVFEKQEAKIVHRIIEVSVVDGEYRYVTKGDANNAPDSGYVTAEQIIGTTNFKVAAVGYPTLWLHQLNKN